MGLFSRSGSLLLSYSSVKRDNNTYMVIQQRYTIFLALSHCCNPFYDKIDPNDFFISKIYCCVIYMHMPWLIYSVWRLKQHALHVNGHAVFHLHGLCRAAMIIKTIKNIKMKLYVSAMNRTSDPFISKLVLRQLGHAVRKLWFQFLQNFDIE